MGAVFERRMEKAGPSKLVQHLKARPSLITLDTSSIHTWKKETANVVHKHSVYCMCLHRHPHTHMHICMHACTQANITKEIFKMGVLETAWEAISRASLMFRGEVWPERHDCRKSESNMSSVYACILRTFSSGGNLEGRVRSWRLYDALNEGQRSTLLS